MSQHGLQQSEGRQRIASSPPNRHKLTKKKTVFWSNMTTCGISSTLVKQFKGAERKTRDEERRAAKRKMTATGRKKMDELYHPATERSEFYAMSDLAKPPVLFTPAEDIDKLTSMELQGFYSHETDSSRQNDLPNFYSSHFGDQPVEWGGKFWVSAWAWEAGIALPPAFEQTEHHADTQVPQPFSPGYTWNKNSSRLMGHSLRSVDSLPDISRGIAPGILRGSSLVISLVNDKETRTLEIAQRSTRRNVRDDKKDGIIDSANLTTDGTVFSSPPIKRAKMMAAPSLNERVMLYVRQDSDDVYTPLHVVPPTTQGLLNAIVPFTASLKSVARKTFKNQLNRA
ncbi:hypothetical protein C0J52_26553 [Blattella germanica]|nr:hypothetical protein C0J52_26553 [Blattella germanica]